MWLSLWRCCLGDDVFVVEMFDEMLLVLAEVLEEMLFVCQNKDSKRIMANSKMHSPVTRIIPFRHRWGNLI